MTDTAARAGTPSGAVSKDFGFGTQIRKSPYFDATVRWGRRGSPSTITCTYRAISVTRRRTSGT